MAERTKSAWPENLVRFPREMYARPLAERLEFYRTQMPEAQYRDYLAGVNDAANPADDARQGRLM
jgi:hypothetical protein